MPGVDSVWDTVGTLNKELFAKVMGVVSQGIIRASEENNFGTSLFLSSAAQEMQAAEQLAVGIMINGGFKPLQELLSTVATKKRVESQISKRKPVEVDPADSKSLEELMENGEDGLTIKGLSLALIRMDDKPIDLKAASKQLKKFVGNHQKKLGLNPKVVKVEGAPGRGSKSFSREDIAKIVEEFEKRNRKYIFLKKKESQS